MRTLLPLFCLLLGMPASHAILCPTAYGYKMYGMLCLKADMKFVSNKQWESAEAICMSEGGHLASFRTSEEKALITGIFGNTGSFWLGMKRRVHGYPSDGGWSDNTPPQRPWFPGTGNCLKVVSSTRKLEWDECVEGRLYLCRIEVSVDQRQAKFQQVPGGITTDPAVSPSATLPVTSMLQCARRCHQDIHCVHYVLREDSGKYWCDTYITLHRTPSPPINSNYQKILV